MITSNSYEEHVAISKELKMHSVFLKVREPYKNDFEDIYNSAKEEKINLSNAKEFLNSLSKEQLSTVQNYSRLADEINVGKLTNEGAYNLLLHHYEKYDFNNDGIVMDGTARTTTIIPTNMPESEKKAYVQTLNEMDENEAFNVMALITLPKSFHWENGELIPTQGNEPFDFNAILETINRILNPKPQEYTSPEIIEIFKNFKTLFEKNYDEVKNEEENFLNNSGEVNIIKAKLEASTK